MDSLDRVDWLRRGSTCQRLLIATCVGAITLLALVISTAPPALAASSFPDVPEDHAYYDAIVDMADRGIISGYTDGNFGIDDPVTRQQFAKLIVKTMNVTVTGSEVCPFKDVPDQVGTDPLYPSKYVAVCAANGITTGKTSTTFDPTGNITRQQVMTMIVRAADNLAPGSLAVPTDQSQWGLYYGDPTHGANVKKFDYNQLASALTVPYATAATWQAQNATRGEVAVMLWNLLGVVTYGPPPDNMPQILSPPFGSVISTVPRTTTVSWAPVSNATSYLVRVSRWDDSSGFGERVVNEVVSGTSYTFDFDGPGKAACLVHAQMPIGPISLAHLLIIEYTQ